MGGTDLDQTTTEEEEEEEEKRRREEKGKVTMITRGKVENGRMNKEREAKERMRRE